VAATFDVLAEPHRRRILDLLLAAERPVGELVEAMSLSQPLVSKHLRVLRGAGLVEARTDAQRRIYRVRPEPLREIDEWLQPYRERWGTHLDALEEHLRSMDEAEPKETRRRRQRGEHDKR
jgi:DNA-binding transcriptional ArsR family regulator